MNFIEAVKLAKEGKKIRNKNWISEKFLILDGESGTFTWGDDSMYLWAYLANYTDIESSWELFEEEKPKTYSFQEALLALNEGKKIIRLNEYDPDKAFVKEGGVIKVSCYSWTYDSDEPVFSYDDILASDWIIKEKE